MALALTKLLHNLIPRKPMLGEISNNHPLKTSVLEMIVPALLMPANCSRIQTMKRSDTPMTLLASPDILFQQLSMASTWAKKNKAWKESRQAVLKIKINGGSSQILSPEAIITKCAILGFPFDAIKTVQFPPLETDRMLLIVDRDLDAREIRRHEKRLQTIINDPGCRIFPEEFYISPASITRGEVNRMETSTDEANGNKATRARFKKPNERLEFWRRETGLNIHRAYWTYGRIWLVLRNLEEAQTAASGKMYTLEGLQTSFE